MWRTVDVCCTDCAVHALAAKAVEAQGKGAVVATKAVETQGKGAVLATKAVEAQGKDSIFATNRIGNARQRQHLCHEWSGKHKAKTASLPRMGVETQGKRQHLTLLFFQNLIASSKTPTARSRSISWP